VKQVDRHLRAPLHEAALVGHTKVVIFWWNGFPQEIRRGSSDMFDHDEDDYASDESSFHGEEEAESDDGSELEQEMPKPARKSIRKSTYVLQEAAFQGVDREGVEGVDRFVSTTPMTRSRTHPKCRSLRPQGMMETDNESNTPLHVAARKGNTDVVTVARGHNGEERRLQDTQ
jgi:hypothetical protein